MMRNTPGRRMVGALSVKPAPAAEQHYRGTRADREAHQRPNPYGIVDARRTAARRPRGVPSAEVGNRRRSVLVVGALVVVLGGVFLAFLPFDHSASGPVRVSNRVTTQSRTWHCRAPASSAFERVPTVQMVGDTPSGVTSPGPTFVSAPEVNEASPPLYCRQPARHRLSLGAALVAVGVGGWILAGVRLREGSKLLSPAQR
jgi:hypothetical protein